MSREEIIDKFKTLANPVCSGKQVDRIIDSIALLDKIENAAEIGPLMAVGEVQNGD